MRTFLALLFGLVPPLWSSDGSLTFTRASSQYVEVPDFHTAGVAGEVTVEFWARAAATTQQSAFMLDPDHATNRFQAHLTYINGNTYWDFGNRRAQITNPANTLGNWMHYALVCSDRRNLIEIYLNGALLATTTSTAGGGSVSAFNPGGNGAIGYRLRIGGGTGYHFGGGLDEFRVWNVARSEVEIRRDLFRTLAGNEPGLRLYFKFDEDTGTVAANSAIATGPAYNGTLVNGPVWSAPARSVFTVFNTNDSGPDSLRTLIDGAPRATVIRFAPNLSGGTIRLTSGQLDIDPDDVLAIDASALPGGITISGDADASGTPTAGDSRVFEVAAASTVLMDSLRITGGKGPDRQDFGGDGGGINNSGNLTLVNSTVTKNRGGDGGIVGGSGGWGGGIWNGGSLHVLESTVSENRGGFGAEGIGGSGGGIYSNGSLFVRNSSLLNNRTGDARNGNSEGGGGISCREARIVNTTISNNHGKVGGGIQCTNGELTVVDSTITGNRAIDGGGIYVSYGSLKLSHSIVAGNLANLNDGGRSGIGPDLAMNNVRIFSRSGANLIGDNSDVETTFPVGLPNANGDFVGSVVTPLNPRLGPLAANGGPTLTYHPLPGSPAINPEGAPDNVEASTDQRGFPRVVGGRVDIGAVEVQPAPTLTAPRRAVAKNGRALVRGSSANASKVAFAAGKGRYRNATGIARWRFRLSGIRKPVTRINVRATSIDGRAAQKTVLVRKARKH